MITVVMVRHQGNPKKFLFRVPDGHTIKDGMHVIVDTKHGMQEAVAITDSIDLESEEAACKLFQGVTLPLKRVMMVKTKAWEPLLEIPFSHKPLEFLF